ncbi:hypothetical protein FRC08_002018 [Ceratobasidium sp. 394]|nr:hypothetical protein FRC08_002018 [Ceratobasidium sp. 394]
MRGESARKTFFDRRDLNFTEGYRLLFGGVPLVEDIVEDAFEKSEKERASDFIRRLTLLLRPDRLTSVHPQIMADLERNMVKWGTSGKFDPFNDIYSIVFQATIRTIGCREIADSVESCKKLEDLYWHIEKRSTPTSLLLPWFPSPARKMKMAATTEMYMWLDSIIKARQNENWRENDALQDMLDSGESTPTIVQTVMGALFAGIVNSGLMAAWVFILLDQEPEWRVKVIQELKSLLNKYAPSSGGYASAAERFSDVSLEAWENEMPILEDCLRETIRTFLVYSLGETHSDPNIYPEPNKFNPSRFAEGPDKSQAHGFLGWGVGRHPCAGRRFAQYEIKAIVAMFLASYDYEVINSKGVRPDPSTTVPDRNNILQASGYIN